MTNRKEYRFAVGGLNEWRVFEPIEEQDADLYG